MLAKCLNTRSVLETSRLFRASSILTLGPEFSPYTLLTSELDNSWLRSHTVERLTASLGSLDTTWQQSQRPRHPCQNSCDCFDFIFVVKHKGMPRGIAPPLSSPFLFNPVLLASGLSFQLAFLQTCMSVCPYQKGGVLLPFIYPQFCNFFFFSLNKFWRSLFATERSLFFFMATSSISSCH